MRPWLLAGLVLVAGCSSVSPGSTGSSAGGPDRAPVVPPDRVTVSSVAEAESALAGLVVAQRPKPASDYSREAFGSRWADVDGNGCNQRDDVLQRDGVPGSLRVGRQGRCDHDVLAGTWLDPYAGRRLVLDDLKDQRQAQAVQIDHVVPLAEAWISGAREWSPAQRELFANDLGVLLAVDGPTNASKGSSDPAAWKPRKGYQCAYAWRWISVKATWGLATDPSEVRALREMLAFC